MTIKKEMGEKADEIRNLIAEWYPKENKLELFAREHFDGWDCYGNELPKTIQKFITKRNLMENQNTD